MNLKMSYYQSKFSPKLLFTAFASSLVLSACGGSGGGSGGNDKLDTTAPVISLQGDAVVNLPYSQTYNDPGATASDDVDGSVSVTTSGSVDSLTIGSYTITYSATDAAGNKSTAIRTVTVVAPTLSGTAAAGAAIVGTVTVKDSLGATKSQLIEADGTYNVDVTGMTPPFRLRAEGTVGGKVYKLHSYAEQANTEGSVNITPFTDLIIANAAKQVAASFFDEETPTNLDVDEVKAQETALQTKLQSVFSALGLDTAIDLLNTSFKADHSGLDAALDLIKIETSPDNNIATITNLIDNSFIEDDIEDGDDNDEVIEVKNDDDLVAVVSDNIAIANVFKNFTASFDDGLPTAASLESFLAANFLQDDQSRSQFLADITTDPSLVGLSFSSVSIRDLDGNAGTAMVDFNVTFDGVTELEPETWQVAKNDHLGWQLLGNQLIVEADTLTFHCNDYNGIDDVAGSCGLNASFYDNDFTNNGTDDDAPLASATMEIIDANDGTVKETVYFGNASYNGPGELSVYNQTQQGYTGDYVNFGAADGEVDPSIFKVGDIIRYKLYSEALDISVPNQPYIPAEQPLVSFDRTLIYLPKTSGLYPALTTASINAINNFDPAKDLTVSWAVQENTVIDSILVEVYDSQGNRYDIEDEGLSHDATSTELETTALITSITNDVDFDQTNYTLLVRVYAIEPATGQFHSTDYRKQIVGNSGGETGGGETELSCVTESDWDDVNDKPTTFFSIDDFNAVIADCANQTTSPGISKADLANVTWYVYDERLVFDANSDLVLTTYGDDGALGTADDEQYFATVSDISTNVIELTYSQTKGGTILGTELLYINSETTFGGKTALTGVVLFEAYDWQESDKSNQDTTHKGAEIFHEIYSLDANFEFDNF